MVKQTVAINKNFKQVNTQEIFKGDSITGLKIGGMPSSRLGNQKFSMEWATKELTGEVLPVNVSERQTFIRSGYWKINLMHFVKDQPILVKRNNIWQWFYPDSIREGDLLFGKGSTPRVDTIKFIQASIQTVELKVDLYDTFFLNSILVHNRV